MDRRYRYPQSYYRLNEKGDNIRDESRPLVVNCTGVVVLDRPFSNHTPRGRHDCYLMYVLQGELEAQSGDTPIHLAAGDLIIYPPERSFAYQLIQEEKMVYLWLHFTGSAAESILKDRGIAMATAYHPRGEEELIRDFEEIQRLFITRPAFYLEEASARLDQLLSHIARAICQPENIPSTERIQKSLDYLNRHYAETLPLELLAGMEYLSVSRYAALFRQMTGLSPQQYLIDLRLRNARELLRATNLSIGEVARSVGYEDALYFSRLFHRHTGQTPREFRLSHR